MDSINHPISEIKEVEFENPLTRRRHLSGLRQGWECPRCSTVHAPTTAKYSCRPALKDRIKVFNG